MKLKGIKTYLLSALGVAAAALGVYTGQMTPVEGVAAAAGALGLSTVRAGSKTDAKDAATIAAGAVISSMAPPMASNKTVAAVTEAVQAGTAIAAALKKNR